MQFKAGGKGGFGLVVLPSGPEYGADAFEVGRDVGVRLPLDGNVDCQCQIEQVGGFGVPVLMVEGEPGLMQYPVGSGGIDAQCSDEVAADMNVRHEPFNGGPVLRLSIGQNEVQGVYCPSGPFVSVFVGQ